MLKLCPTYMLDRLHQRFERLYGEAEADKCLARLRMIVGRYEVGTTIEHPHELWDQTDAVLITYADMMRHAEERPLETLKAFCDQHLQEALSTVHILPFCPYSSDDGFSVIDYRAVNKPFGKWEDIEALGEHFSLMFDLVLNHCSRKSAWAKDYIAGNLPEREYFIEMDPETDLSSVTRPRPHPLLTPIQTRHGETHLWATFSADQLDLNFANPDVLFEFIDILFLYIAKGARIIRLDAIAYLWKEVGTTCIHLPQTHEVVKLFHDILQLVAPHVILLTETNVPHAENMSYFGDGDEANMIYNFTLPPLLLHTLLSGDSRRLTTWASELPDPGEGRSYFNFTASHDGIGVRPIEDLLDEDEKQFLYDAVIERGGHISTKANSDGSESPYEMNITYFDALAAPGEDSELGAHDIDRFLCSQTIAMAIKGVPAVYLHSLTATRNYYGGVKRFGYPRAINRRKWNLHEVEKQLEDKNSPCTIVFQTYRERLALRRAQLAFHPSAAQTVVDMGESLFCLIRTAVDGSQSIAAISNVTEETIHVPLEKLPGSMARKNRYDLIGEVAIGKELSLAPYQTVWLTESPAAKQA
ncbi:MAG: sugar phosphorylase [Planctomycetota bacterium]|jgi:sucrose phosphorylase